MKQIEKENTSQRTKCVYCNSFAETKEKSKSRRQSRVTGGITHLLQLIAERLSTEYFRYTGSIPIVECHRCRRIYEVFCDNPNHCCEVIEKITPFDPNINRIQELSTKMVRKNIEKWLDCNKIKAITQDMSQKMVNIVLDNAVLVLSDNGKIGEEIHYVLEDIL